MYLKEDEIYFSREKLYYLVTIVHFEVKFKSYLDLLLYHFSSKGGYE